MNIIISLSCSVMEEINSKEQWSHHEHPGRKLSVQSHGWLYPRSHTDGHHPGTD